MAPSRRLRSFEILAAAGALAAVAACLPADESLPLGSVEFTITGRGPGRTLSEDDVVDGWSIHIDRFLLSFRSMAIGNTTSAEQCSYRGRGANANVVFDGAIGTVVQTFNGVQTGHCPAVSVRFGPPDDQTVPGQGATAADLVMLAQGRPAHALLEATARRRARPPFNDQDEMLRVSLRFETDQTSSAFGGCRAASRGVTIRPFERASAAVDLDPSTFFRDALSRTAALRFLPFYNADRLGDGDGTVTMDDLDRLPLASAVGPFYELPDGTTHGSFGAYVRAQFMFAAQYDERGLCNGVEPGRESE